MSNEPVKVLTQQELPEALKVAFGKIFELDTNLAALKSVHIEPVADERTAQWRDLKAATGIARKDLELYYRLYKRDRDAGQMDDEDAGQQIQADLRRLYNALAAGETLDWLGAVDADDAAEPEEDDGVSFDADDAPEVEDVGADDGDREPEQEASAAAPEVEAETGPDADWGAQEADASDAAFDNAGQVFNEGEAAGIDGKTPQDNPYSEGIRAATWERGRKSGIRKALEGVGGNVVPMTAAAE